MLNIPFAYDKVATGKQFICRNDECEIFIKTITESTKGVVVYGSPKTGVESLVVRGLSRLKEKRYNFLLCEIDLFNIRSYQQYISRFGEKLSQAINNGSNTPVIVYFKEFQNILLWENGATYLEQFEKEWAKQIRVKYILTGSFLNMMKYIFEEKKYFFYTTEIITLSQIPRKNAIDYIVSTFLNTGRVIEENEAGVIYDIMQGNMWYIKHFCAICLSLPIGYVNSGVIDQAITIILSLNIPHFMQIMADLTENQINFLKAVLDQVTKFSSSEVLEKYKLNSSANVFRLKDALKKKEVITFDSNDNATIIDPLFKYWLKHYYFEK